MDCHHRGASCPDMGRHTLPHSTEDLWHFARYSVLKGEVRDSNPLLQVKTETIPSRINGPGGNIQPGLYSLVDVHEWMLPPVHTGGSKPLCQWQSGSSKHLTWLLTIDISLVRLDCCITSPVGCK